MTFVALAWARRVVRGKELTPLAEWLLEEMRERNLSARQTSEGAGLTHSAVSKYLEGVQPSKKTCAALARFFGVPQSLVLIKAGWVEPPPSYDQWMKTMGDLTQGWSESDKELVLRLTQEIAKSRASKP